MFEKLIPIYNWIAWPYYTQVINDGISTEINGSFG